mgnify:CR=1 FL=1
MRQRLTVKEAAAEIGCNVEYLRRQMKAGRWDLGSVIKPNAKIKNYQYFIFRAKLDKFLGIEPRSEPEKVQEEGEKSNEADQ